MLSLLWLIHVKKLKLKAWELNFEGPIQFTLGLLSEKYKMCNSTESQEANIFYEVYLHDSPCCKKKSFRNSRVWAIDQGCYMVRKSQKKLKKMTKVRQSQVKIGGFWKKSGKNLKKTSDFFSSNLKNILYLKALDW